MKRTYPESRRKRIIFYYSLGVVLPGLILGILAFRGIRNDQALREKQTRTELQVLGQDFFSRLELQLNDLPDSLFFLTLTKEPDGVPQLIYHRLIYLPDGYLKRPVPAPETDQLKQAWAREFQEKDPAAALKLYEKILTSETDSSVIVAALNGMARDYLKTDRPGEAVGAYRTIIDRYRSVVVGDHLPAAAVAMSELISLYGSKGDREHEIVQANQLMEFLSGPPVVYEKAHYEYFWASLMARNISTDTILKSKLQREKSKTDFLIGVLESPKSLFNGDDSKRKYLESKDYPALFVQESRDDGVQTGQVIDLKKLVSTRVPQLLRELDPDQSYSWNILTEQGEKLFPAPINPTGLPVQISFPVNFPPWKLVITPIPLSKTQILFGTSQGLFVLVFVFIAILMLAGLIFMMYTLNQEMKLSKLKSDFISNVSHEFKTPLTSIRHMTEIMYLKRIKSEVRKEEYLQSMLEQCDHLGHLIENILDFSKIEEDIKNYRFEWHNIDELLRDLVPVFRSRGAGADFDIEYRCVEEPPLLYMDKDAMLQVFYNLLDNACKYSGGVRKIEVTLDLEGRRQKAEGKNQEKDLRGKIEGERVVVRVRDFGLGIPEKDLPRVFERFYRGDKLRTEGIKGSGIGLTIVKRIVEAHKGEIGVESEEGKGSVFTVYLPIDQNQNHDTNTDH